MEKKMEITTTADDLRNEFAPLYCHYSSQHYPQPAYLMLDPAERRLEADYNVEIGNAVPFTVWHNRIYRLPIPATLRGFAVAALLEDPEVLRLAESVFEGHSIEWDGNNHRGYLTEDGVKALEALEHELTEDRFSEADYVQAWDVEDWLCAWSPTPGETLDEATASIERDAEKDGILLVGDVLEYLQNKYPDAEIEKDESKSSYDR